VTDRTGEDEGRERIAERDRDADIGERAQEYRRGEVTDGDDALARARAAAVDENSDHGEDQPPGVTPLEEEWQRAKQMAGGDADDTGSERMGRPEGADELPDSGEVTQG
jgi:hypothetical protein